MTGQKMHDYPMANGKFLSVCIALLKDEKFTLPWLDRLPAPTAVTPIPSDDTALIDALAAIDAPTTSQLTATLSELFGEADFLPPQPTTTRASKIKYSCPTCWINVWGKAGLSLRCEACDQMMGAQVIPVADLSHPQKG
ncbi:MAG: hypothetical protein GY821_03855 [Gammaproteobacteria bacterium]|nr:hypothetical protein [Gammaproteobacteria bacterium]